MQRHAPDLLKDLLTFSAVVEGVFNLAWRNPQEYWNQALTVATGFFWDAPVGALKGIGNTILHPIDTVQGIYCAITHPQETLAALKEAILKADLREQGNIAGSVALIFIPAPKVLPLMKKIPGRVGETAGQVHKTIEGIKQGVKEAAAVQAEKALNYIPLTRKQLEETARLGVYCPETGKIDDLGTVKDAVAKGQLSRELADKALDSIEEAESAKAAASRAARGDAGATTSPKTSEAGTVTPKAGETASTAKGKEVHKAIADARRASNEFDLVQAPITDEAGNPILVSKRVDLKTGQPQPGSPLQEVIPDAVSFKRKLIIDDKPLGRPISKDRQEIIRFIKAYEKREGRLPDVIAITRYDPKTGQQVLTELYSPKDFLP